MLKEVGLPGSGNTDLVGIDKNGNIFIIETKLATNPEAKRTVIGQILEYAAFLHEREVDWLDAVVRTEKNGVGITQHFEKEPDWDKEEFEQKLRDNLQEGTFNNISLVLTSEVKKLKSDVFSSVDCGCQSRCYHE